MGLSQDPFDSECSASTYFSMSLAHKYVNLKEPYNQDIKKHVTTNFFWKKGDRIYMKSPTPEAQCAEEGVFQIQSPVCGVNF